MTAYAAMSRRLWAMALDSIVGAIGLVIIVIVGGFTRNVPGSGRVLVGLLYALIFLYEPLLVWRFGATIGHHAANLRVVDDATGGHPPLGRAFVRFLLKRVLGAPSFLVMVGMRRHQALHDKFTHTTVQIRDLERAAPEDYHTEPVYDAPDPGMPSPLRRALVIGLYSAGAFVVAVVEATIIGALIGRKDSQTIGNLATLLWVAGTVLVTIAGWQGSLLGARRRM